MHLIFSLLYYRKGNDRALCISHRACSYKNTFSPQIGHFRLGNSKAMLIRISKTLLSANGSLFPSLRKYLIVWFYIFSSGTVCLGTLGSDTLLVANLYRITLVITARESSVGFAIMDQNPCQLRTGFPVHQRLCHGGSSII